MCITHLPLRRYIIPLEPEIKLYAIIGFAYYRLLYHIGNYNIVNYKLDHTHIAVR